MQLLFLLLLLSAPFFILTLLSRWSKAFKIAPTVRVKVCLSLFFLFTAIAHFVKTDEMAEMMPPSVPYRVGLIYITGVLELLGAIGIWIPRLMKMDGICLILMLIGLLPANIYSAISHVDFGGHGAGPVYLLFRVPFQLFLIWCTYFATEQHWFRRQSG